jgi:hypothetical protein
LEQILVFNGFRLIDQSVLLQTMTSEEERAFYIDDINTILTIGKNYNADIIITGKAISRAITKNNSDSVIFQSSVNLYALNTDNGKTLGASDGNAEIIHTDTTTGGNSVIAKAAENAIEKLIPSLNISQTEIESNGYKITLIVNGLKSIEDLIEFRKEFEKAIAGLRSIERRTYTGSSAAYDLVTNINGDLLADTISSFSFDLHNVLISSNSQSFIELNVKLK